MKYDAEKVKELITKVPSGTSSSYGKELYKRQDKPGCPHEIFRDIEGVRKGWAVERPSNLFFGDEGLEGDFSRQTS